MKLLGNGIQFIKDVILKKQKASSNPQGEV